MRSGERRGRSEPFFFCVLIVFLSPTGSGRGQRREGSGERKGEKGNGSSNPHDLNEAFYK